MKAGDLNVSIQEEEILWYDRKRTALFGLPWSFTRYKLTKSRLFLQTGFFNYTEDEVRLYRITDITFTQTFLERLNNTGTICILSSDVSKPEIHLLHIKNAKKIKDIISQCVEVARRENGVRASELVGNPHPIIPTENKDAFGPEIIPDINHDGIDDRLQ